MIRGVTAVLLAGGRSSRFGSDKALEPWENGKRLIEVTLDSVASCFKNTLVLTKNPAKLKFLENSNVSIEPDVYKESHPLGGIYSGLFLSQTRYAFVTACDMPFIHPDLVRLLCRSVRTVWAAAPVWMGHVQPLCGAYDKRCIPVIKKMIEQENYSIQDLFQKVPSKMVSDEEIKRVDSEGLSFFDIDTREDYRKAKEAYAC